MVGRAVLRRRGNRDGGSSEGQGSGAQLACAGVLGHVGTGREHATAAPAARPGRSLVRGPDHDGRPRGD